MTVERMNRFIIMLLLEDKASKYSDFNEYFGEFYSAEDFNKEYQSLLDEFLTPYALNKTEKSD